jgi:hypothetical protein
VSYQSRDDLLDIVYRYAAPLLGESTALSTVQDLSASPVVLTANHHGVDYFAQSVQGSLIFSLKNRIGSNTASTVPVFSCGAVPLDNLTYPLGALFYHVDPADIDSIPQKLPIFSNKVRRGMVSVTKAFDETMIDRVVKRFQKMVLEKSTPHELAEPFQTIMREDYSAASVMQQSSYSRQSVVLNNRIWRRLFAGDASTAELVYLELEKIVALLLEIDLRDSESLAWLTMFDAHIRESVIAELDGDKTCWDVEKLAIRSQISCREQLKKKALQGSGTFFFWGITEKGRRVPLYLGTDDSNAELLCGVDDRGKRWSFPFEPDAIIEGLQERTLLPSLFTSFLVISMARGVTCLGGYYQAEYLPAMQRGVVNALNCDGSLTDIAAAVQQVSTFGYLSGMQTVMKRIGNGQLVPAGPVEIISGGGLTDDDIEQIMSMTVRDAHTASLFETIPDIAPWKLDLPDWKGRLASDCGQILEEKVAVK